MVDNGSRTGDAPGDEGPHGSVVDPGAHSDGDDSVTTVVGGGDGDEGTSGAASREVADEAASEPTRSE
ncbi:hypothetical protein ACFQ34_05175 [Pseudonocardia benzenivorans]|jgi:hypothetical protein|uniref:Uncharacterized protein n=2 Tax=Pseudonocardia TaxID=1847 RepID=F4CKY2_PSEUX|nr:hypothetical protein [Pseudonocardia dioxanivorans]AEA23975.1 hypothetical protein Psed_1740 [Pseudonocardia dioxanivorans CB1190]